MAAELRLINSRLMKPSRFGRKVIPLILKGNPELGLTPQLEDVVSLDCGDERLYFRNVFDLICTIYELPPDNLLLDELRRSLRSQMQHKRIMFDIPRL